MKVKKSKLNLLHTKVRNSNALGLDVNKVYKDYKNAGGKRTLTQLINRKPIKAK